MSGESPSDGTTATVKPDGDDDRHRRDLIRSLRHELRTPINHILGYSELLIEEADDANVLDLLPDLEQIHAAGKQALAVVSEFLDPARATEAEINTSSLREQLSGPLDQISSSGMTIQRIAESNGQDDLLPDIARIEGAVQQLRALVSDDLSAISASIEPQATTARESEIPSADSSVAATSPLGRMTHVHRGSLLVVDDNESNRDMLARRLERLGYEVAQAVDGRHALDTIAGNRFDLILLDIMMPELNGYQVLERLKADEVLREIPVIVISALDELSSVVRCIEMGAEDYLAKPFDPVLLRARIGACLEKKRLRDQEIAYLEQVARVTAAAGAVEAGNFEPASLDTVAKREDELGQMARVFQRMAREVYAREQRLKQQVHELRIEIDRSREARQVAEITDTDYFRSLQSKARSLRRTNSAATSSTPEQP